MGFDSVEIGRAIFLIALIKENCLSHKYRSIHCSSNHHSSHIYDIWYFVLNNKVLYSRYIDICVPGKCLIFYLSYSTVVLILRPKQNCFQNHNRSVTCKFNTLTVFRFDCLHLQSINVVNKKLIFSRCLTRLSEPWASRVLSICLFVYIDCYFNLRRRLLVFYLIRSFFVPKFYLQLLFIELEAEISLSWAVRTSSWFFSPLFAHNNWRGTAENGNNIIRIINLKNFTYKNSWNEIFSRHFR